MHFFAFIVVFPAFSVRDLTIQVQFKICFLGAWGNGHILMAILPFLSSVSNRQINLDVCTYWHIATITYVQSDSLG